MRYIDTGSRASGHALGAWFEANVRERIVELRWQTGYFSFDGIGIIAPLLERLAGTNSPVRVLVGGNQESTLSRDVLDLLRVVGVPRSGASVGVVSFGGALFHPKVYHFLREDGSASAYVGSANLTWPGVTGLNVEAGMVLDTRDGDPAEQLIEISKAIDNWFDERREGLFRVDNETDVEGLVAQGVLFVTPPSLPSPPPGTDVGGDDDDDGETEDPTRMSRARLAPLFPMPRMRRNLPDAPPGTPSERGSLPAVASVPRTGYPDYFLFQPSANAPTAGALALSGSSLPSGAEGIIFRFNKDSGRHLEGRGGTANISIPIVTVPTLRFGVYGKYKRPRAEFGLETRYLGDQQYVAFEPLITNVMGYGYAPNEPGHKDVRLLVPAALKLFRDQIAASGLAAPGVGDIALLEWPTQQVPNFRLSMIDRSTELATAAAQLLTSAATNAQLVGNGACWLPARFAPSW